MSVGSTFGPLKEDKKHGKSKSKGRSTSSAPGIPRHVQKELGTVYKLKHFKQMISKSKLS